MEGQPRPQGRRDDGEELLTSDELTQLNRIVSAFLDIGEDMANGRQAMTMADWDRQVDDYLRLLRRDILAGAGSVSRARADAVAHERYDRFDLARRDAERLAADAAAESDLRRIENEAAKRVRKPRD